MIRMTQRSSDREAIEAEIDRIRSLGLDDLRTLWRTTFRSSPPKGFTKDLVARFICWHIQEQAFGGLDPQTAKVLDGFARNGKPPARRLKAGTVLVREYQGERHTVTVVPGGYVWRENTYASLSTIARAITGRPGTGRASSGSAQGAINPSCPPSGLPPIRAARVAARRHPDRCNHEDTRPKGLPLRHLHSQIDRA